MGNTEIDGGKVSALNCFHQSREVGNWRSDLGESFQRLGGQEVGYVMSCEGGVEKHGFEKASLAESKSPWGAVFDSVHLTHVRFETCPFYL